MKLTNKYGLPQPLYDAMLHDDYSRGDAEISATQIISPARMVELIRQHDAELEEDASDRVYALLSKILHKFLEEGSTTGTAEQRMYADANGWRFSGAMDRYHEGVISDWKMVFVREWQYGIKEEREQQLNIYAHLARANGLPVTAVEAVLVFRDWSKRQRGRGNYPQASAMTVPLPLWSPEKAALFIEERVRAHQAARVELPECTPSERWARPDTYAVMKPGRKSALRVLEWEAEAIAWLNENPTKGAEIVKRPGESIRCVDYCSAASVCSQWEALREADGVAEE